MGYINPLLRLPAGRALLDLPAEDRARIEAVMRDLRDQANVEAETSWRRRKGPMAAYWRAVATYARHIAHALSTGNGKKRDWWDVLGVERGASAQAIGDAYRSLASLHHPDRGGSADRMAEINAARDEALQELAR